MRVLITGGMGFIGINFIRHLLSKYDDMQVVNLDRLSMGSNVASSSDLIGDERYRFVRGDMTNYVLVSELVKDMDAVINIGAETHVDRSISDPHSFLTSNAIGAFTLLEALRRNDSKATLEQVSTDEVYGDIEGGSFREVDMLKPSSPYAASKASADMFVLAYHRTYGMKTVITRCTNNFGPFQFPEKLIPKTILRASMNLKVPIYGTGNQIRDWIYVLDHCEALDIVLRRGEPGEIYNIAGGNEMANIELVRTILKIMDKPSDLVEFVKDRPGHDVRYSLDCSKIVENLGWRPVRSFDETLKATVEWYLNNQWWWRPLADERVLHPTPWMLSW